MLLFKALARGLLETFNFKNHLSRIDFIINCLVIIALMSACYYIHNVYILHFNIFLAASIVLFLWFISLAIRRLHDLKMSAWWLLFPLVVGGGFYLVAMIVQSFLSSNLGFMYILAGFVQIGVVVIMLIILLQAKPNVDEYDSDKKATIDKSNKD